MQDLALYCFNSNSIKSYTFREAKGTYFIYWYYFGNVSKYEFENYAKRLACEVFDEMIVKSKLEATLAKVQREIQEELDGKFECSGTQYI